MNATLGLEDEAGFTMVSPVKRTWSRRGQTPVFRTSIDHHARLNILGVVLVSPKGKKIRLSIKSYWDTITGEEVIAFLKQILRLVRGHVVLVWDRHTIHIAKGVSVMINGQKSCITYSVHRHYLTNCFLAITKAPNKLRPDDGKSAALYGRHFSGFGLFLHLKQSPRPSAVSP